MTPQDHNKMIGIMHLIWGGFNALMMVIILPFLLFVFGLIGRDPQTPPEARAIFGVMGLFFAAFAVLFTTPSLVAGYGLLKRKSWGRVAGIVAACLTALNFPFGTALCVYTMWFLFGQQGEHFYRDLAAGGGARASLHDAATFEWEAQRTAEAARRGEYVPPPQPPDWRGQ